MRHPLLLAAALAFTAAACTPAAPPADSLPAAAPDVAGAARTAWEARGPAAYAYQLEIACMCIHRGQYAIEVRDGEITTARDAGTGAPTPDSRLEWLVTIDRLLEVIRQASSAGTQVRATYDPRLGYPVEAEIGALANDQGTLYRITNFRAL